MWTKNSTAEWVNHTWLCIQNEWMNECDCLTRKETKDGSKRIIRRTNKQHTYIHLQEHISNKCAYGRQIIGGCNSRQWALLRWEYLET